MTPQPSGRGGVPCGRCRRSCRKQRSSRPQQPLSTATSASQHERAGAGRVARRRRWSCQRGISLRRAGASGQACRAARRRLPRRAEGKVPVSRTFDVALGGLEPPTAWVRSRIRHFPRGPRGCTEAPHLQALLRRNEPVHPPLNARADARMGGVAYVFLCSWATMTRSGSARHCEP